ncbi:6316_t:CDS:2 [Funneliformis caledonium]|uniref:6316_t:CDS:1 n=1 Tax=Funneliformis caledonium TaxID=1117310 RepID=A0A9N8YQX2_9GLOM|nr:6316_t:CDS:2 [Funneliformis caledonium]
MLLEIASDLLTILENNDDKSIPKLGLLPLILWNFSFATKSFAIFIALARSMRIGVLQNDLESIVDDNAILLRLPSNHLFDLLLDLKRAMKQFRKFCSKTHIIIGFLFCEIMSLMIFNLDQFVGDFIRRSFYGTMIILGVIMQSSSAVYIITVIILCTQLSGSTRSENNNTKNVQNHTLSDFTNVMTNKDAQSGFTSYGLRYYFKKHNRALDNFPRVAPREEFEDVELGNEFEGKKQNFDIIVNKVVEHEFNVK